MHSATYDSMGFRFGIPRGRDSYASSALGVRNGPALTREFYQGTRFICPIEQFVAFVVRVRVRWGTEFGFKDEDGIAWRRG